MKFQNSLLLMIVALVTMSFIFYDTVDQPNSTSESSSKILALPLPPTGNLSALYSFASVDTLQYSAGMSAHLAVIEEANGFVFLDAYCSEPSKYGNTYNGGFNLRKIELVNGKYTQTKKGAPVSVKFHNEHVPGFNKFIKTEDGYMAFSSEAIVLFGNDLESKKVLHHGQRSFISAAIIKGTTEIAIVSLKHGDRSVDINIYDYSSDTWLTEFKTLFSNQKDNIIEPNANNLIQTSDGNLFITLKTSRNCSQQTFGKLDYSKLKSGAATLDFIIWQKQSPVELKDIKLSENGTMTALLRVYKVSGETEHLERITANTAVTTTAAFDASIQSKKTLGVDQVLEWDHFGNVFSNGETVVGGIGLHKYGFQHSPVFIRYDANMKVLGQYRLPTYDDSELFNRSRSGVRPFSMEQNQHSMVLSTDDIITYGMPCINTNSIQSDYELFVKTYMGDMAAYQFLPSANKDIIYIMTTNALLKVNFTKYTPCTVKWETKTEADARYAGYASNDDYEEPTTTTSKPTTNNTASTPAKVTTLTIKNDLTTDQNTKYGYVKIVFDGGSRATTTIQKGHTLVIDCEDVKGVYVGNLQNTSPGKLLFKTAGNCGKTLNLSNYW